MGEGKTPPPFQIKDFVHLPLMREVFAAVRTLKCKFYFKRLEKNLKRSIIKKRGKNNRNDFGLGDRKWAIM